MVGDKIRISGGYKAVCIKPGFTDYTNKLDQTFLNTHFPFYLPLVFFVFLTALMTVWHEFIRVIWQPCIKQDGILCGAGIKVKTWI